MNASTFRFFYRQLALLVMINAFMFVHFSLSSHDIIDADSEQETIQEVSPQRSKKRRKRKRSSGKKIKRGRTYVQDMDKQELKETQERALESGNLEFAIKCTEQLIKICTNGQELPDLMICLASLYFDSGNFETAVRLYSEFVLMYPGRYDVEFASYRALLAQFYLTLDPDRDQTHTQTAITMANEFLERSAIFTQYAQEVEEIRAQCYQKEAESELRICSFYLNQDNLKAAQNRITGLRENFLPHVPYLELEIAHLEKRITTKNVPLTEQTITVMPELVADNEQLTPKQTGRSMKNRF